MVCSWLSHCLLLGNIAYFYSNFVSITKIIFLLQCSNVFCIMNLDVSIMTVHGIWDWLIGMYQTRAYSNIVLRPHGACECSVQWVNPYNLAVTWINVDGGTVAGNQISISGTIAEVGGIWWALLAVKATLSQKNIHSKFEFDGNIFQLSMSCKL